jgi:hypothetical protein
MGRLWFCCMGIRRVLTCRFHFSVHFMKGGGMFCFFVFLFFWFLVFGFWFLAFGFSFACCCALSFYCVGLHVREYGG